MDERTHIAGVLLNVQDDLKPDNEWGHHFISHNRDGVHDGDCTKQCYTCCRCVCDEALKQADIVIREVERFRKETQGG